MSQNTLSTTKWEKNPTQRVKNEVPTKLPPCIL